MVNKTSKSKTSPKSTKTAKSPTARKTATKPKAVKTTAKTSSPKSPASAKSSRNTKATNASTQRSHKTSQNIELHLNPATRVILTFILLAVALAAGFSFVLGIPATVVSTDVSGLLLFANIIILVVLAAICITGLMLAYAFYRNRPFTRVLPLVFGICCLALIILIFLSYFSMAFALTNH